MPFSNPVMGGPNLIRPVMKSPNFSLTERTGWAIYENGDAIFFGIVLDGGSLVISGSGQGVFLYSGVPAQGDLYLSIASDGGTDAYGNAYVKGVVCYSATEQPFIQVRPDLNAILMYGV